MEKKQTNLQEHDRQPESDNRNDLSSLLNLIIQRYEGETCEGQFHGKGVAHFEGGHVYKGMFSKGFIDGRGVFTRADGLKYVGGFVRNLPMGQGTYSWPDGSSYEGEVCNGQRHGTGTHKWAKNVLLYTGQWDQGKRNGKGEVYYNQDKTSWYKGDWVKNRREGWGVRCYPSGNLYSGEWKNNVRHGQGTMRWQDLAQQYVGMWQNGVQHGKGTHVWILRQPDDSHYVHSNWYTGDFAQGQRHGQGTFYYTSGVTYEGQWSNNERHAKGKFIFKDGRVFEGELSDSQMMTQNIHGDGAPLPLYRAQPGKASSVSILSDMAVKIECLLDVIPERRWHTEHRQVEDVVLLHRAALKSVYSFYSRLGHAHSPGNAFVLTRLQLWRLLKDCHIHDHDITRTQIERFIRDASATEIHSPFTPVHLIRFLSVLVVVAHHIYHKDMASQENLLAACFSKLMTDDILPNAKNVKGFLFRRPNDAAVAVNSLKKCWEIFQAYCKVKAGPRKDETMTHRHLLWMFKDLHLLDDVLTTARLLEIISAESRDPSSLSSCLTLEITFLEFCEVLVGSAEVRCQQVSEGPEEGQSLCGTGAEARRGLPEVEASGNIRNTTNSVPQSAHEHRDEGKGVQTKGMEAKDQIQNIHQSLNQFFLPAFEHYQSVLSYMKEETSFWPKADKEPEQIGPNDLEDLEIVSNERPD